MNTITDVGKSAPLAFSLQPSAFPQGGIPHFNAPFIFATLSDSTSLNELRVRMGLIEECLRQGKLRVELDAGEFARRVGLGGRKDRLRSILTRLAAQMRIAFNAAEWSAGPLPLSHWSGVTRPLATEGPCQRPLHFGDGLAEGLSDSAWDAERGEAESERDAEMGRRGDAEREGARAALALAPPLPPRRREQLTVNSGTVYLTVLEQLTVKKKTPPQQLSTQLTVNCATAAPAADDQSQIANRKSQIPEHALMDRLHAVIEPLSPGDMKKWGGDWRVNWVRKYPGPLERTLNIIEEKLREGWRPSLAIGAAIKDECRRIAARWGKAAEKAEG